MSSFTKQDFEDELRADAEQTRQDEYHERMMQRDWDYFTEHNPQMDAIAVLLDELSEEQHWEMEAILEYLAEPYKD